MLLLFICEILITAWRTINALLNDLIKDPVTR